MNSAVKKKIWRENAPLSTRIFLGIWIFGEYFRVAVTFVFFMLFLTHNKLVEETFLELLGLSDAHYTYDFLHIGVADLYYAIGNEKTVHNLMTVVLFILFVLCLAIALWLHLGKSRVIAAFGVIGSVEYLMGTLVMLLDSRLNMVYGMGVSIVLFLIGIIFLFIYIGILKATCKYHILLKKEIQYQKTKTVQVKNKYEVKEPYSITKPRLKESIYTAPTDKNVNVDVIHIDNKHNIEPQSSGKSVYGGESVYGGTVEKHEEASSTNRESPYTEAAHKNQQEKARIRIEKDEDILGKDPDDAMYKLENRPSLSSIKKTNEEKAVEELTQESAALEEGKEEIAESVIQEPMMEELEDGVKVDTSLGYRRITFDDL